MGTKTNRRDEAWRSQDRRGPARLSDREYLQLQHNLGNTPEPTLVRRVFLTETRARRAARAVKFAIPDLWRD